MYDRLAYGRVRKRLRAALLLGCAACVAFAGLSVWLVRWDDSYQSQAPVTPVSERVTFPSGEGLINVNTADSQTLQQLKGIGPAKAQALIAEREASGAFCYP